MSLRERIVGTVLVNVAWTMVYIEIKGQFASYWIMVVQDRLGV